MSPSTSVQTPVIITSGASCIMVGSSMGKVSARERIISATTMRKGPATRAQKRVVAACASFMALPRPGCANPSARRAAVKGKRLSRLSEPANEGEPGADQKRNDAGDQRAGAEIENLMHETCEETRREH